MRIPMFQTGIIAAYQNHIWRMRLLEVQLRAAIECGSQWEVALEAARALLKLYRWLYPKV